MRIAHTLTRIHASLLRNCRYSGIGVALSGNVSSLFNATNSAACRSVLLTHRVHRAEFIQPRKCAMPTPRSALCRAAGGVFTDQVSNPFTALAQRQPADQP